ncbi:hypothetical protein PR202_gb08701 [Eleusine coracana subsp. coracana]|uniref:Clp ATPase C-terminal domain-containing protein n=1 Tax=Eleusine coracana subsp. coracana TaxID=191504 RepID=A0AAV5EFN3_ELECO|nr:hypothetical protein PR202_gb08701 [Eleusine coracana subsp. coracana]
MQADNLLKENGTEKCPEIARKKVTVSAGQIAQDEKEKLIHLADSLHKRVVGQQEAVNLVAQAVLSYQGRDGGGQLTDKVRKLPYSVILLNEIEKAGPEAGERLEPDLVSMLSGIVVFEPLSQDNMREVAKIQMKGIIDHFSDKGITVFASDSALDVALSLSHNPVYGARPIIRWLQMKVTNKLHEMLIKGELAADAAVIVDATEDKKDLQYIVVKDAAPPAAGEAVMDSRTEASEVDQSCMFM